MAEKQPKPPKPPKQPKPPKPNIKMPSAKAKAMGIPKGKAMKKTKPLKGGLNI